MRLRAALGPLVLAVTATIAFAWTESELLQRAQGLDSDYATLAVAIDACPGGQCGGAAQIVATFDDLEGDRAQLHADRATLPGSCPCVEIDAALAAIDADAHDSGVIIDGWGY